MRHIPGDPSQLRRAAAQISLLGARAESLNGAIATAKGGVGRAGNNQATSSLVEVLDQHREKLSDLIVATQRVAAALSSLAAHLEQIEAQANAAASQSGGGPFTTFAVLPLPGYANGQIYRSQGSARRSTTASLIDSALPKGEARPLVVADPSTLNLIWDNLVVETVDSIAGLIGGAWDWSFGFLITPSSSREARDAHLSVMEALRVAIVDDKFPDGTTGAREMVLRELGYSLIEKELLDKDPAAWFVVESVNLLLLLAGGAAIAKKAPQVLKKLNISAKSLKIADVIAGTKLSPEQISKLSPTLQALHNYPAVFKATQTALTKVDGIWDFRVMGLEGRGRRVEDLVYEVLKQENPRFYQLAYNHQTIDIATDFAGSRIVSVKSIDTARQSYFDSPSIMKEKLRSYAKELEQWERPYAKNPIDGSRIEWNGKKAAHLQRDLYIGIPSEGLTPEHARALNELVEEFARSRTLDGIPQPHININFVEVAR